MTESPQPGHPIDDPALVTAVPPQFQAVPPTAETPESASGMISFVPGALDVNVDQEIPLDDEEAPDVIDVPRFCPGCGTRVAGHEQFCEACGLPLVPTSDVPVVVDGDAPTVATQRRQRGRHDAPTRCTECGGSIDPDGYCETCGAKARSERDHFEQEPAPWLAGVCDRGVRHERNEDAMALAVDAAERGIVVVCDGVSTSDDSDISSLAGASAARDLLVAEPTEGQGTPDSLQRAIAANLIDATVAANAAVIDTTDPASENAASCTIVAVVVTPDALHFAHLGDSRLYWFGDDGQHLILTDDDSVAQTRIAMGVPREEAETGFQAHAITRWLGRDSDDIIPHTGTHSIGSAGWVVVCSDGLWNYASAPEQLWSQMQAAIGPDPDSTQPLLVARSLVTWANQQGGRDNITVAVARLTPRAEAAPIQEQ